MDTIFKQISDAVAAALQGLPEVGGRVFVDQDFTLPPDQLPALVFTPGDDSSSMVGDDMCEVRMELQFAVVTATAGALASVDPVERALHARLMGDAALASLLDGSLKRVQGTRRVLRSTDDTPSLRQITYMCKTYVSAADMSSRS